MPGPQRFIRLLNFTQHSPDDQELNVFWQMRWSNAACGLHRTVNNIVAQTMIDAWASSPNSLGGPSQMCGELRGQPPGWT
jgi:hypothetical protein